LREREREREKLENEVLRKDGQQKQLTGIGMGLL